jgi:hypothetical protein
MMGRVVQGYYVDGRNLRITIGDTRLALAVEPK